MPDHAPVSWVRTGDHLSFAAFAGGPAQAIAERAQLGVRTLVWGSLYPRVEGTYPRTGEKLADLFMDVPEDDMHAIVAGNAARLFGFDLNALSAPLAGKCLGPHPLVDRITTERTDARLEADIHEDPEHSLKAYGPTLVSLADQTFPEPYFVNNHTRDQLGLEPRNARSSRPTEWSTSLESMPKRQPPWNRSSSPYSLGTETFAIWPKWQQ
jgi:hypothetical protein